jgi:hypothetical protein
MNRHEEARALRADAEFTPAANWSERLPVQ